MNGVVNCAAYADGRRVADLEIEELREALKHNDRFVWIGLHEPDEALLRRIQEQFSLHDLAVEDAHSAHQRPKVERYGDGVFIVLRTAQRTAGEERIAFGETHIFLGPRFIVSVRHGPSLSYAEVRARCEATPRLLKTGPAFALYAIMDFIVDQYFPLLDELEAEVEALEESIFSKHPGTGATARIYRLQRDLIEIRRAVSPLTDVCNRLMRFEADLVTEEARPYFRDVYDHAVRINELVDTLRELTISALEANLALISVEQNNAMKKLAGWAAIFAVPTMIAGIYGMNFDAMPELRWRHGYPVTVMGMGVACALLHRHFKKAGWI